MKDKHKQSRSRRPLIELVAEKLGRPDDLDQCERLILAGQVRVNGQVETRVRLALPVDVLLAIEQGRTYVSRSAYKLKGALEQFPDVVVKDRVALDIGAAHGGFTQVLLEAGAARVYALDVAYGIIDYALRQDPRVVMLERRNVRHLQGDWLAAEDLSRPAGLLVVCDVSFMSMNTIARPLVDLARQVAGRVDGILLLKPQFEASELTEGGVLKDADVRERVVAERCAELEEAGVAVIGAQEAVLRGSAGNQEFVLHVHFRGGN